MLLLGVSVLEAALPPVPFPAENPPTAAKRILGKILFWDEQLSSDNSIACGSCHRPEAGGSDPREGRHPGTDPGTIDDVRGSPGITLLDTAGRSAEHPLFGLAPQVTKRTAPSVFGALWADRLFWDGRADGRVIDPVMGDVAIRTGGALENQALASLADSTEMARPGRPWSELTSKLAHARPLALATRLPNDLARRLAGGPDYPALFVDAFGDPEITPVRIAFAIATYERSLVTDQTPWDAYQRGALNALDEAQRYGWQRFQELRCVNCHTPPLFTSNDFFNIGLRRVEYDRGRQDVTGDPAHAGDMRVPSLRNAGLRARYMHTGEFRSLAAAIGFYNAGAAFSERDDIPDGGGYNFDLDRYTETDLQAFIGRALTDPRVLAGSPPFDRPLLRSERAPGDRHPPATPVVEARSLYTGQVELRWMHPFDDTGVVDYVLRRDGALPVYLTTTHYLDPVSVHGTVRYEIIARDAALNASAPARLSITPRDPGAAGTDPDS